jgi:hypothetical protein
MSDVCPICGGVDIARVHDPAAIRECENCGYRWSEVERLRCEIAAIRKAVADEREACATIAVATGEKRAREDHNYARQALAISLGERIASAIRARTRP